MGFISNFSTRAKLLWGFGLMLVVLVTVSAIGYRDASYLKDSQKALFEDDLTIAFNLMSLRNAINRERVVLLSLAVVDASQQDAFLKQLETEVLQVATIARGIEGARTVDAEFAQKLLPLTEARRAYAAVREQQVIPALKAGKRSEASAAVTGPLLEKFKALRQIADDLGESQLAEATKRMHDAEELVKSAQSTLLSVNIVAVLIGLALVFWLDRAIATPLKRATLVAEQIAGGDLTVRIPAANGSDEVGQLMRALDKMVSSWAQLMAETNAGIVTLSAAASEILAGTMQASAGAAETAAAVSETTATVEEVKQTAMLASQKSRTVSDAAQKAAHTATTGRKAIEDGIAGMESIQEKMELIAETIVRLSERSQAIAEIIVTVSGLAEQSNLLAVNAAIEAAKAGDQGKGFGVVAQEVKNLADQSKQATRQVRQILSEIQKAISSAVMLAEQGSKSVTQGAEQSTQAGNAIRLLSDSIADAAQASAQIAASSQQQLAGMDQVALAMENINQVSAENAAGSKQAEASAQNLHQLGQKLKQMSERFKL